MEKVEILSLWLVLRESPDSRGRVWWSVGRGHEPPGHGVCLPREPGEGTGSRTLGPTESPPGAPSP